MPAVGKLIILEYKLWPPGDGHDLESTLSAMMLYLRQSFQFKLLPKCKKNKQNF